MTDLAAFCPRAQIALRLSRPVLRQNVEGIWDSFDAAPLPAPQMLAEITKTAGRNGWLDRWANEMDALFAVKAAIGQTSPEQDAFTATLDLWRAEWLASRDALLAEARAFAVTSKAST